MTDQFPREPGLDATQGDETDIAARLAGVTQRSPSLSIYTRKPVPVPAPAPSAQRPDADEQPAGPVAPAPASPGPGSAIGRLSRVPAARLWPDGPALARWLADNPAALAESVGIAGARFDPPDGSIALGSAADGTALCVVCEVGPSTDESLGILLRIAAVQESGGAVLWLVGEPSDTHVAALSWLNRSTAPRFSLVRVTGVQIDGSASAPMFERVVRPPRRTDAGAPPSDPPPGAPRRRVDDLLPGD